MPKHPKTKPKLFEIIEAEKSLPDIESMIESAIENAEIVEVKGRQNID